MLFSLFEENKMFSRSLEGPIFIQMTSCNCLWSQLPPGRGFGHLLQSLLTLHTQSCGKPLLWQSAALEVGDFKGDTGKPSYLLSETPVNGVSDDSRSKAEIIEGAEVFASGLTSKGHCHWFHLAWWCSRDHQDRAAVLGLSVPGSFV